MAAHGATADAALDGVTLPPTEPREGLLDVDARGEGGGGDAGGWSGWGRVGSVHEVGGRQPGDPCPGAAGAEPLGEGSAPGDVGSVETPTFPLLLIEEEEPREAIGRM